LTARPAGSALADALRPHVELTYSLVHRRAVRPRHAQPQAEEHQDLVEGHDPSACAVRNSLHLGPPRRGAGPRPAGAASTTPCWRHPVPPPDQFTRESAGAPSTGSPRPAARPAPRTSRATGGRPGVPLRMGPPAGHQPPMPAQRRARRDENVPRPGAAAAPDPPVPGVVAPPGGAHRDPVPQPRISTSLDTSRPTSSTSSASRRPPRR